MTKPSDEQRIALRVQLSNMQRDQWLAMVRWCAFKLVEDQELLVMVITDEVDRRRRLHEEMNPGSELMLHAATLSVLNDLNLCIGEKR
jgi:hypothetical protein